MTQLEVLDLAMSREQWAHIFCRMAYETIQNPNAKEVFRWLAGRELEHYYRLLRLREASDITPSEVAKERTHKLDLAPFEINAEVKESTTELPAFEIAIAAERESLDFYTMVEREAADPDTKATFQTLLAEVRKDLSSLEAEYERVGRERNFEERWLR